MINSFEHSGVSIILCTYNGKCRLPKTLKYLANQKVFIPCEIILVDNASKDGTKQFADKWWQINGKNSSIMYRSYIESKPGKSYAQELGYKKAKHDYILICDDDNWLNKDYVQTAFEIMEQNQSIGALGGWSKAIFEYDKPTWFDNYSRLYAVGKQASLSGDITKTVGFLFGAGMVIQRAHWNQLQSLGFTHILSCRKGDSLSSGGDTEYCYALRLLGYKIWYDERLYFEHFIPENRLNLDYISRLRKAMAYSNFVISAYQDVLSNRIVNKRIIIGRIIYYLKNSFFLNLFRLFFGTYEQKEVGKGYFRKIKFYCFYWQDYMGYIAIIQNWLPTRKVLLDQEITKIYE